ncbi:MAG: glycosyltransferase family 4 protein [Patescibacteria group bacterium]|nr:glycosyltransferase family 4 protein [Patescibacteria group bacterium]MDD5164376.1 glycosyltransferase family 4 protein [Patescibacteria group bacterium]MDD5534972.1 glycosyltransferase family 4 protein [Patescibacteria group bacterium]
MNIAHIVSTFPPYFGGMGNTCYSQVKEFAKRGHNVLVLTPRYGGKKLPAQSPDFRVIYLKPFLKFGNAAMVPQVTWHLKDFDIIHLHWPFIGAEFIIFAKLCGLIKKSLVVQYQMDLVDRGWRGIFFKLYSLIFIPLLARAADKILVSSFDYAHYSHIRRYVDRFEKKFIAVPLGVDTSKFYLQPKDEELLKKYNLSYREKIVLFVGGLDRAHYFKGIDVLIKAIADINCKLIIVGEGDLKPKYQALTNNLNIKEKVIFAGHVSDEDLPKYYNLADVCVLPSIGRSEAFGLVLVEAMACAKPIIVSDLPGPRTLVQNNGFKVKIRDVNDLRQKISLILEDQVLANQLGAQSFKLVKEQYNWPTSVQKLEQIYHEEIVFKN